MAAPGLHVGHFIQRNSRFLLNNFEPLLAYRGFAWTPALRQQAAEFHKEGAENIVIPKKKTWSKEAVLEALASTVSRDITAYPYQFQDDPYLYPRSSTELRIYSLSQESGRSAAKYFVNSNPKFFTKDFAEPHIPCLMPDTVSLRLEEVSEEALKERINLRKVTAAVDMYDQLHQAGSAVSMETIHDLLDLICLYSDRDPVQDGAQQPEDMEGSGEEGKKKRRRWGSAYLRLTWKENNNAERIFNLLPERDTRCYSALIRGMAMHGAFEKAFSLFTDLLNNRLAADIHIFNALILAAPNVRETYNDKWALVTELLKQMSQQKIRPNLLTFNNVLRALKRCGAVGRSQVQPTLNEMKALGITPTLASFNQVLAVFFRSGQYARENTGVLQEVMSELEGTRFTCQDHEDVMFFVTAMKICLEYKDLEMAYKVQDLVEVGDNWRLLGNYLHQSIYYGSFFSLLCQREQIDVVLKWYRRLVPSMYYPNTQALKELLQALDTDSRLDLLPTIWKDIRSLSHDNKNDLVQELLTLMARDQHSPEVQESFAVCALDVKSVFEEVRRDGLEWSASSISSIASLLLRANRTDQAWEMMQLFRSKNRVPGEELLEDFLTVLQSKGSAQRAVELVQLSASFCLSATPQLIKRTKKEFDLTEEQRAVLIQLDFASDQSD